MQSFFNRNQNIQYNKIAQEICSAQSMENCVSKDFKAFPCFLDKGCNPVPLQDYVNHLMVEHGVRMCRPILPVCAEPFRISYKFNGTVLSYEAIIWKYFGQAFSPVLRFQNEEFNFSVVWIGGLHRPNGFFSVKMKVRKPGGSKFFSLAQEALKLKIPVSPMQVASDGTVEGSAGVVLKRSFLAQFCKKSGLEGSNTEEWEWDVIYEIDLSD
ncbi:unnamed protein product [Allacma fusca]|uniref:Uncharacterized protein n=1 Tax=Allacma fusca TaxID=39272 RepID=A0A8J2LN82_9HEXA|nr:unnamed protein product [Allacma fusca]